MDPLTLLVIAVAAGGLALAAMGKKHPSTITPPKPGQKDPLIATHWYRVACSPGPQAAAYWEQAKGMMPPANRGEAAAYRFYCSFLTVLLESQGLVPKAWSQDTQTYGGPVFVAIGYFVGGQAGFANTAFVQFFAWQEVAEPPEYAQQKMVLPSFDPNMPVQTADAVNVALLKETDPAKLLSFADSLLPDYPAAAGMLKTKASLMQALKTLPVPAQAAVAAGCECDVSSAGFFDDVGKAIGGVASDVGHAMSSAVKDVDRAVSQVPVLRDVVHADPIAFLVHEAATGRPLSEIGKDFGNAVKNVAPIVESVVAVVPGIGPEVASGIALGCALAEGKRIDEAALDAACAMIPGGALAHDAAKAAAHMGLALLNGDSLDRAAAKGLGQLRDVVPGGLAGKAAFDTGLALVQGKRLDQAALAGLQDVRSKLPGGPAAQAAFDTAVGLAQGQKPQQALLGGLDRLRSLVPTGAGQSAFDSAMAVAHGKKLQDAGYPLVKDLLPGGAAQQAAGFLKHLSSNPRDVQGAVEGALQGELSKLGGSAFESVHKAVSQIVATPVLGQSGVLDLAKKLNVAEPIARAALACVSVPKPTKPAAAAIGAGSAASAILSKMVVVNAARLRKFGTPPARVVSVNALKYANQRGAARAAKDAIALHKTATAAPGGNARVKQQANDLGQAARLLKRGEHIRFYLALKTRIAALNLQKRAA